MGEFAGLCLDSSCHWVAAVSITQHLSHLSEWSGIRNQSSPNSEHGRCPAKSPGSLFDRPDAFTPGISPDGRTEHRGSRVHWRNTHGAPLSLVGACATRAVIGRALRMRIRDTGWWAPRLFWAPGRQEGWPHNGDLALETSLAASDQHTPLTTLNSRGDYLAAVRYICSENEPREFYLNWYIFFKILMHKCKIVYKVLILTYILPIIWSGNFVKR